MGQFRWQLVLTYVIIILLTLTLLTAYVLHVSEDYNISQKKMEVLTNANVLAGYVSNFSDGNIYWMDLVPEQIRIGTESRILLLRQDGTVVMDTDQSSSALEGKYVMEPLVLGAIGGTSNSASRKEADGSLVVSAAAPVTNQGVVSGVVYVETACMEITEYMDNLRQSLMAIAVLVSIFIALLSFFLAGMILRPVRQMTTRLKAIAASDEPPVMDKAVGGEIGELVDAFNMMTEKLNSQEEKRQEFVSNASHELKTPLSAIRLISDSILSTPDAPREMIDEFLGDMNNEVDRLTRIINKLLDLTKLENQQTETEHKFELTNVNEIVLNVAKALYPLAEKKNIRFNCEAQGDIYILLDRDRIWESIYNIADNSIKYTPENGSVDMTVTKDEQHAIITIRDTGIGIAPEDQHMIFDRFYRVDKARARETGGTGLGLSIALSGVELHGGNIEVESTEGMGSVFRIIIPIITT